MKKTLLTIPEELLGKIQKISGAPTKSKAVIVALEEYIRDKRLNRLVARMGQGFGTNLKQLHKTRKSG